MLILHEERAKGVDLRLLAFLEWWKARGPFTLTVLPGGGFRTDEAEQLANFRSGASRARTLADTPHGRGGALDLAPLIGSKVDWTDWATFEVMGGLAEDRGLEWGGRWTTLKDGPHIQVPNWRVLPYPRRPGVE